MILRTAFSVVVGALCAVSVGPAFAQQPERSSPAEPQLPSDDGRQVVLRDQVLFRVIAPLGDTDMRVRAAAIQARVRELVKGPPSLADEVRVEETSKWSEVYAGEVRVLVVTEADAKPLGRTRAQVAADNARRLRVALVREFSGKSVRGILVGVASSVIATLVFIVLTLLLRRAKVALVGIIQDTLGTRVQTVQYQGFELLSAERATELMISMARALMIGINVLVFYVYLEQVLSFFPWTRGIAERLLAYVTSATSWVAGGIVGFLPNLVYIAVIVVITRYVLRLISLFFSELGRGRLTVPGFLPEWASPTYKIGRLLILALSAVLIFPYLPGSDSPAFQGVSIFIGVLFSLGSTSAVANMVAGLVLTYMLPFRVGDRVKIADTVGDVVSRNLLVVRVRTAKNVSITIPNAMVLNHHIVNYSSGAKEGEGVILHATVTIGYDVPWRQVHDLLLDAAAQTKHLRKNPKPFILQTALDDFYVHYEVNAFTRHPDRMLATYSELYANIQDRFNEANVEILSPHYRAARDGNEVTIPQDYLPKDYTPGGFRIFKPVE